jgi:hypothetical protein
MLLPGGQKVRVVPNDFEDTMRFAGLVLIVLLAATAACGGRSGPGQSAHGLVTYTNTQEGFSFEHNASFGVTRQGGDPWTLEMRSPASLQGATTPAGLTFLKVIVSPLRSPMSSDDLVKLVKPFGNGIIASWRASGKSVAVDKPFTAVRLNGRPAIGAEFSIDGVENVEFVLVNGNRQYTVTGAASAETWNSVLPNIRQALDSFRLVPTH